MRLLHKIPEEEIYFLEESTETISGRLFEAENASKLLFGTSKELIKAKTFRRARIANHRPM